MTKPRSRASQSLCAFALLTAAAAAQPLPGIALSPPFPALAVKLPAWMAEAPDGSHRCFILEQDGRILLVPRGSDGKDAKEFLNIVDRQPHAGYEQGLLGLAFHPQFKSNGLFYICYSQPDPRRSVISEFKVSADD